MEQFIVKHADKNKRLDVYLVSALNGESRSRIQSLISEGFVTISSKVQRSNYRVRTGDVIDVVIPPPEVYLMKAEKLPVSIIYEDEHILVVDKEKGMVVHPACGNKTGTLVNALLEYCDGRLSDINGEIRPGIVHRIDKDTSGVLVVAKTNLAHRVLSESLKTHSIKRVYVALAMGIIAENTAKIDAPLGRHPANRKKMTVLPDVGKAAITHISVIQRFRDSTYLEATLETGRTHQIRAHLAFIGHPLAGDKVYGREDSPDYFKGQALHAKILGFMHPVSGEYMEFNSPLPEYFEKALELLKNGATIASFI